MEKQSPKEKNLFFNKLFMQKTIGIFVACIMMILGVTFFLFPTNTIVPVLWLSSIGFLTHGLYHIITYIKAENKNIWLILFCILNIAFAVLFVIQALQPLSNTYLYDTIAYLLSFYCFLDGGLQFFSAAVIKKEGGEIGWITTTAVIHVILAILILTRPLLSLYTFSWVLALFFTIFGILLLVKSKPQPELEKNTQSK